jgi:hypothetical protein
MKGRAEALTQIYERNGIPYEVLDASKMRARFPQVGAVHAAVPAKPFNECMPLFPPSLSRTVSCRGTCGSITELMLLCHPDTREHIQAASHAFARIHSHKFRLTHTNAHTATMTTEAHDAVNVCLPGAASPMRTRTHVVSAHAHIINCVT